ncbi:MAG: cold-shock DNA-binding domain protein [Microbacteriaceae bacterium]|nr:cold-shock DNA-binding domain protein [Microbacteriaceae bacterium]
MATRLHGTLTSWNDDRGFGFIAPTDGGKPVFVHISEFDQNLPRPAAGDDLTFDIQTDARSRTKAVDVRGTRPTPRVPTPTSAASYVVLIAFVVLGAVIHLRWPVPPWIYLAYGGMTVITFIAYALDKRAAVRGGWRTPEASLLLLGFLCGWPGALIAQVSLRHKTQKLSFRRQFWITVAANVVLFVLVSVGLSRA